MSAAQALGAAAVFPGDDDEPGQPAQELVAHLLRDRGWPDRASAARWGVEKLLTEMAAEGYLPAVDYLEDVTRIIDELSALDLSTTVPPGVGDGPGDLDRLAMRVAVGTYRHSWLLVALLQLGHTSHSIRRYDPQA